MTLEGVIYDMNLDLDSYKKYRFYAMNKQDHLAVAKLEGKIEEIKHWKKLLEKVERESVRV